VIEAQRQANEREVLEKLAEVTARKQDADPSTSPGSDFEKAVFGFLQVLSQKAGDVATPAGSTTGLIKYCKKGDILVELGPEYAAAGAGIVAEAKENASFTLQKALAELFLLTRGRRRQRDHDPPWSGPGIAPGFSAGRYAEAERQAAADGATTGRAYALPGYCRPH
jgi:hypothetical protein